MKVSSNTITKFNEFILSKTGGYDDLTIKWRRIRKRMFKMLPLVERKEKTMQEIFREADSGNVLEVPDIPKKWGRTPSPAKKERVLKMAKKKAVGVPREQRMREAKILADGLDACGVSQTELHEHLSKPEGVEPFHISNIHNWKSGRTSIPRCFIEPIEAFLSVDFKDRVDGVYCEASLPAQREPVAIAEPTAPRLSDSVLPFSKEQDISPQGTAQVYACIIGAPVTPEQAMRIKIADHLLQVQTPDEVVETLKAAGMAA